MNTTIYVVRHGTTKLNEEMKFQGIMDIPLNELGEQQGTFLSERFKDIPIDVAISSPLKRARKTMEYILEYHPHLEMSTDARLQEINGGICEGRSFVECELFWPGNLELFTTQPGIWKVDNGESGADVYQRMSEAINEIVEAHRGKVIAIATHGFAIAAYINYVKGIEPEKMEENVVGNVAISKFIVDQDNKTTIEYIGDNAHLPPSLHIHYDWEALKKEKPAVLLNRPNTKFGKKIKELLKEKKLQYVEHNLANCPLHKIELERIMELYDKKPIEYLNITKKQNKKDLPTEINEVIEYILEDQNRLKTPIVMTEKEIIIGYKKKELEQL